VQAEFKKLEVIAMKADWTSRDEVITRTLAQFGRSGVPLYVLYSGKPDQPPVILPEVITPSIVLTELKKLQ
jgi:thiol:disulfide interchange protein DsbD